jgi:hypothetical protein
MTGNTPGVLIVITVMVYEHLPKLCRLMRITISANTIKLSNVVNKIKPKKISNNYPPPFRPMLPPRTPMMQ